MSALDDEARAEGACCAAHRRNNGRPVRAEIAAYRAEEDALSSELARALAAESDARVALVVASEKVKVVSERFQLFRDGHEDRRDSNREGQRVRGSVPLDEAHVESLQLADLGHQTDHADARLWHESSLHVADAEAATSGDPAKIMAGTPDTVPPCGDGASLGGPATTTGPSTSEAQHPVSVYVASQVRRILAARRIPRKTLAPVLGMTPSGVSRLVNGHTTWMAPEIALVARFFGIPVDDLFPPQTWLEDRP